MQCATFLCKHANCPISHTPLVQVYDLCKEAREPVAVTITGFNSGGLLASFMGHSAFMPFSAVDKPAGTECVSGARRAALAWPASMPPCSSDCPTAPATLLLKTASHPLALLFARTRKAWWGAPWTRRWWRSSRSAAS